MQFSITTILAFAATAAFAAPLEERQVGLCSSGNPVCCATDVLDLADLDCAARMILPLPSVQKIATNVSHSFHHPHQHRRVHQYLRFSGPAGQVLPDPHPWPGAYLLGCQPYCSCSFCCLSSEFSQNPRVIYSSRLRYFVG